MKHVVSTQQRIDLTTHVMCNKCNGSCVAGMKKDDPKRFVQPDASNVRPLYEPRDLCLRPLDDGTLTNGSFNGLIEHTVCGVYGSDSLEDMTSYTFSLCEHCLKELFDTFATPPATSEYDFG